MYRSVLIILVLLIASSGFARELYYVKGVYLNLHNEFRDFYKDHIKEAIQAGRSLNDVELGYGVIKFDALSFKGDIYVKTIMPKDNVLKNPERVLYWGLDLTMLQQSDKTQSGKPYYSITEDHYKRVKKSVESGDNEDFWIKEILNQSFLCQYSDHEIEYEIQNMGEASINSIWTAKGMPFVLINTVSSAHLSNRLESGYDLMFLDLDSASKEDQLKTQNKKTDVYNAQNEEEKIENIEITYLKASSMASEPFDKNNYHPVKVFDGDPKTCWLENVPGPGLGEYLEVGFSKEITVDAFEIQPGVFWPGYWRRNNRLRRLEVEIQGKKILLGFKDVEKTQRTRFKEDLRFKRIKFTIIDVYKTTQWDDSGFSHIDFLYKGKKIKLDFGKYQKFFTKDPE